MDVEPRPRGIIGEEASISSAQGISHSTYGLLEHQEATTPMTRIMQGSKKSKIILGFFLSVALMSVGAGYIALHNGNSIQEVFPGPEGAAISTGQFDLRSPQKDIRISQPKPLALAQSQERLSEVDDLPQSDQPQAELPQSDQPQAPHQSVSTMAPTIPAATSPRLSTTAPEAIVPPVAPVTSSAASVPRRTRRKKTKKPKDKVLPENASSMHPVSLLNEMFMATPPDYQYFVCHDQTLIHGFKTVLTLNVNGTTETFTGYGQTKKTGRRIAAKEACKVLYGFEYSYETIPNLQKIKSTCSNSTELADDYLGVVS